MKTKPTDILGCILLSKEQEHIRSLPHDRQRNGIVLTESTPDLHQRREQTAASRPGKEKSKIQTVGADNSSALFLVSII